MIANRRIDMRPAVLGGPRAVTLDQAEANRWPILTAADEAAVLEVIRDGDLSLHPVTRRLEDDYRGQLRRPPRSGPLQRHGRPSRRVLRPRPATRRRGAGAFGHALGFGRADALGRAGARLLRERARAPGARPGGCRRRIGPRTRAIVVVHLWGMPSRMTEILALARRHGLKVIEDASHSHGAVWRGRPCGTLGDLAVFSLQSSKLAPAGEGGILLTQEDVYHERAVCLGDVTRILELPLPGMRFAGTSFGLKTRMAPSRRPSPAYSSPSCPGATPAATTTSATSRSGWSNWASTPSCRRATSSASTSSTSSSHGPRMWSLSPEQMVTALRAEGCEVALPRYPLLHQQPLFTEGHFARVARLEGRADVTLPVYRPDALPQTEAFGRSLLRLPTFPSASRALLDQYVEACEKVLAAQHEVASRLA